MCVKSSGGEGKAEEPSCLFTPQSGEMHDLPQLMGHGHSTAQPLSVICLLLLSNPQQHIWAIAMERRDLMGEEREKSSNCF